MEEEKAAAYYDKLSRKGEGAARFKQGLGFSSSSSHNSDPFPSRSKASSLFSSFVRASSPSAKPPDEQQRKQAQLQAIQNKLKKDHRPRRSPSPDLHQRRRHSSSRSPDRDRRRHRSREREVRRSDDRRHRSHSRERRRDSDRRSRRSRDRDVDSSYSRSVRRSRSRSPSGDYRREDRDRMAGYEKDRGGERHQSSKNKSSGDGVDYSQLISGYSKMTPAERVKAKMKLQLSETVAKDTDRGMGSGWERFDFNKEAPLDDDSDEIEAADDDASLIKGIGKSFRFSAVESKREEEIKAAHDSAMFGASATPPDLEIESSENNATGNSPETIASEALVSDKVIAMQQTSWRDRARRFRNDSES